MVLMYTFMEDIRYESIERALQYRNKNDVNNRINLPTDISFSFNLDENYN